MTDENKKDDRTVALGQAMQMLAAKIMTQVNNAADIGDLSTVNLWAPLIEAVTHLAVAGTKIEEAAKDMNLKATAFQEMKNQLRKALNDKCCQEGTH